MCWLKQKEDQKIICSEGTKPLQKFRAELVCVVGPGREQRSAKHRESKLPSGRSLAAHCRGKQIALTTSTPAPAMTVEQDKARRPFST